LPTQELPADEKPAQVDIDAAKAALSSVIALKARMTKSNAADTGGVTRETNGLVTVRAKPEKRLNAKDRAKARREKNRPEVAEVAVAATAISETSGLSTAHPKPEKRKNAKERATEKYAKAKTEDGTTPMTAKAKSKVETKAKKTKVARAA
jgi:hypothetical protein